MYFGHNSLAHDLIEIQICEEILGNYFEFDFHIIVQSKLAFTKLIGYISDREVGVITLI